MEQSKMSIGDRCIYNEWGEKRRDLRRRRSGRKNNDKTIKHF